MPSSLKGGLRRLEARAKGPAKAEGLGEREIMRNMCTADSEIGLNRCVCRPSGALLAMPSSRVVTRFTWSDIAAGDNERRLAGAGLCEAYVTKVQA